MRLKAVFMTVVATLAIACGVVVGKENASSIVLLVANGCPACQAAEEYLDEKGIKYKTINISYNQGARAKAKANGGYVPQLYINGKYIGSGTDVITSRY